MILIKANDKAFLLAVERIEHVEPTTNGCRVCYVDGHERVVPVGVEALYEAIPEAIAREAMRMGEMQARLQAAARANAPLVQTPRPAIVGAGR